MTSHFDSEEFLRTYSTGFRHVIESRTRPLTDMSYFNTDHDFAYMEQLDGCYECNCEPCECDYYEPECKRCDDSGWVPTHDYESYLGQMTKPCPECGGD